MRPLTAIAWPAYPCLIRSFWAEAFPPVGLSARENSWVVNAPPGYRRRGTRRPGHHVDSGLARRLARYFATSERFWSALGVLQRDREGAVTRVSRASQPMQRSGLRTSTRAQATLPIGLLAVMLLLSPPAQAQIPPDADWQTIESEHFRVTFEPGLEALARHAAARAEIAYARYSAELTEPPGGRIDIVVSDHADYASGLATPFPSNRIVIFARPPVDHLSLSYTQDWVDLVVVHELAHVFHLDQAGWLGSALRYAFGRLPMAWPLFPTIGTPQWSIEGLATYLESRLTGMGRVEGSIHEMMVRTAVLQDAFERIDEASGFSPEWPYGLRPYVYGSLFVDYIADEYGSDATERLVNETATTLLPPQLAFDDVASDALDVSFTEVWDEWHDELEVRYGALADSLRAAGLTESERFSRHGHWALHPRVSPGSGRVADRKSVV